MQPNAPAREYLLEHLQVYRKLCEIKKEASTKLIFVINRQACDDKYQVSVTEEGDAYF